VAEPVARRQGRLALVIAAAIVIGVVALGIYWIVTQRQTSERVTVAPFVNMDMSRVTTSGNTRHAAISPDGRYVAQVIEDSDGYSLWVRHVAAPNSVRISGPSESDYLWVAFAPDGNSIYYITLERDKGDTALYRVPVLGGPPTMAGYDFWPVAFSPDGKQMAYIRVNHSDSYLMLSGDGGERAIAQRDKPEYFRGEWNAPAWSPDGKTIACPVRLTDDKGEFETIVGIDVKSGAQTVLTQKRWSNVGQPAWLSDGTGLLLTAREGSTLPRQVWHIAVPAGDATRITHDLNDYHDLSLTQDSRRLAVVQNQTVSSIWMAGDDEGAAAKQIISEIGSIELLAWTPDGGIVYHSNAGQSAEISITKADGTARRQLTTDARISGGLTVSPDGRYIFFASDRAGHSNIWRVDIDGQNAKQMTFGEGEFFPECTPDAEWVVYQSGYYEPRLWKMRVDGSSPIQLTVTRASRPAVSADGQMIAYHYLDPEIEKSQWSIGIVSSDGGPRLQRFALPPTLSPAVRLIRWSPDHKSISFVNRQNGLSEIWIQPLDGSATKQVTNFKAEQIAAFDWSPDGRSLAFIRNVQTSDVILIDRAQ
jgi:Tol biopolymer transport system component